MNAQHTPGQRGCYECAWGKVAGCWRCGSRVSAGEFMMGDLPVAISQPTWAAARNRYVAGVLVGGNRHSAEGKTPERAARWLRVRTAGLFAYADACRAMSFADASKVRRVAMRAAIAKATGSAA